MPHSEIPAFLKEFIDHRKKSVDTKPPPEKKLVRQGVKKVEALDDSSLAQIIENKPSKKVVEEYIQKRLDELSKIKMK